LEIVSSRSWPVLRKRHHWLSVEGVGRLSADLLARARLPRSRLESLRSWRAIRRLLREGRFLLEICLGLVRVGLRFGLLNCCSLSSLRPTESVLSLCVRHEVVRFRLGRIASLSVGKESSLLLLGQLVVGFGLLHRHARSIARASRQSN
jgi:hypothetical protein